MTGRRLSRPGGLRLAGRRVALCGGGDQISPTPVAARPSVMIGLSYLMA